MRLKETCPETVFHGFDVGHHFESFGAAVLTDLENNGMKDSEEYRLVSESIEQGKNITEQGKPKMKPTVRIRWWKTISVSWQR